MSYEIRHDDDMSIAIQAYIMGKYELPELSELSYHYCWENEQEPNLFALMYDNTPKLPGAKIIKKALKQVKYESDDFLEVYSEIVFIMHLLDSVTYNRQQKHKKIPKLLSVTRKVYQEIAISRYCIFEQHRQALQAKYKWRLKYYFAVLVVFPLIMAILAATAIIAMLLV